MSNAAQLDAQAPRFTSLAGRWFRFYHRLIIPVLSSKLHARVFRVVARFNPVLWLAMTFCAFVTLSIRMMDGKGALAMLGVYVFSIIVPGPIALWFASGPWIIPDRKNASFVCELQSRRILSAHLHGSIAAVSDIEAAAVTILTLARGIDYPRVRLYSPLFGRPEKEQAWMEWLGRKLDAHAPGAQIRVIHRRPFSRFMTWRYLADFGQSKHVRIEDGRAFAACIEITNFT